MKYSEIIGLQDYFHPVFNIENEAVGYWKQFIPNDQFYEVLRKTLGAIDTKDPSSRKSIWIQGTFGTGKSHAASVIKHLLYDDISEITTYIDDCIDDISIKTKLTNYRKKKRLLPVILKGIGSISNNRTFSLQLEKAVKNTSWYNDLEIITPSDFDRLIQKVNDPLFDWDNFVKKHDEVNIYVANKEEILQKLNAYDIEFYQVLEDALINKEGWALTHTDITEWLAEINSEIISQNKADGLMIFWDEFTSVMDSINSGIINQIQNIAELSEKNNVFFYLISHRSPHQYSIPKEDLTRMNDRFHIIQYRMEPITTYHIISASIRKIKASKWKELRNGIYDKTPILEELITKLTNNHSASTKDKIKDLFPIHPYSAYLSTFIARNIGSTNRSIFGFLYDKEYGFLNYLNKDINGDNLLTADYLWDFFVHAFENDQEVRFNQVLDKYRLHIDRISEKGENYIKVFKGALLLNVLFKVVDVTGEEGTPVIPSSANINSLFAGAGFEDQIEEILKYIDEEGIITRTPNGDFVIEFSSLPEREVERQKESVRNQFKDPVEILKYAQVEWELIRNIFRDNIYRESEIKLFSTIIENEHVLRGRLSKAFLKPYTLKCALFLSIEEQDNRESLTKIKTLAKDSDFQNVIFVVVEEPFLRKNYDKFIDFIARKQVSDNHNHDEQAANYHNYAKEQVKEWLARIKNRYMQVIFRNEEKKHLATQIGQTLNRSYSPQVFYRGIEYLSGLFRNANVWNFQNALKSAEIFILAESRDDLDEKTSRGPNVYLRYLVKDKDGEDYVVTNDLSLKPDIDPNHIISLLQSEIDSKLNIVKDRSSFNIGDELKFLSEAPYGLYTNMPNMALLGFLLRKYVGEIYVSDVGRPIEMHEMRDLVGTIFSFWQDNKNHNKLQVRFGSKEERELKQILGEIFQIEDADSVTDTRWIILEYIKRKGKYPLWSLKYYDDDKQLSDVIDELVKLTMSFTNELDLKLIQSVLDKIKDFQYELKIILKPDNFKNGFLNFLQRIDDNLEILAEDFDDIEKFLIENLQEETGRWKEEEVKLKVFSWHTKKTTSDPQPDGSPTEGGSDTPPTNEPIPDIEKGKKLKIINEFSRGEQELKKRIIRMIEENEYLFSLVEKYFK